MTSTEGASERAEPPCIRPEPLVDTHLPGKATPTGGGCAVVPDGGGEVAANGVRDLENRILRITGYYGYNPGYSSHRREEGSESNAETPGSETSDESRSYQTCTNTALKVLGGLLLVLCVSSSWGVQQAFWGGRDDSQAFCKENSPLLDPVDTDQLPVPHGLEETHRHRCLRPLLLPQGLRLSPVLDRPEGPFHGCSDRGGHHGHHRDCDDGVCGRFPWGFLCGRSIGCGVRQHISSLQGAVQDVPGQCQHWRGGSLPFHHGLLQSHLHLLCATHPLLHQSGALGLLILATLGVPVWTGRTVAGVQHLGTRWRGADVPHSHLHRNAPQCAGQCSRGRFETRGDLQCGAPGGHLHHLPGLPAPAASGGVGLGHSAFPGLHRRQEVR
ncbi:uncharacterized protein slc35f4 isoform 4-T5 [Spinachia spinachia]